MVAIYADTADREEMSVLARNPAIKGFTTNPTLARKAGVKDYITWATNICYGFPSYPVSFEVIADNFEEMEEQAHILAVLGENVYVKIPITNTKGESSVPLIRRLSHAGVRVNATAIFTYAQIDEVMTAFDTPPAIVSVFAGRIADTGRAPVSAIGYALKRKSTFNVQVLWASPRQVFDVYLADSIGCDIITLSPDLIKKLPLEGKNLEEYSRETVQMFRDDALAAGFTI